MEQDIISSPVIYLLAQFVHHRSSQLLCEVVRI